MIPQARSSRILTSSLLEDRTLNNIQQTKKNHRLRKPTNISPVLYSKINKQPSNKKHPSIHKKNKHPTSKVFKMTTKSPPLYWTPPLKKPPIPSHPPLSQSLNPSVASDQQNPRREASKPEPWWGAEIWLGGKPHECQRGAWKSLIFWC